MMEVSSDNASRALPSHRQASGLHAGFWLRAAAWLLDGCVLLLLRAALLAILWPLLARGVGTGLPAAAAGATLLVLLVSVVVPWLYYALFESSRWQATPGKRALGLQVTDDYGCRIGFGRASGRAFGKLISAMALGVGYLLAAWTARKQALHDLLAGCCVVRHDGLVAAAWRTPAMSPSPVPARGMPAWAVAVLVMGAGALVLLPTAAIVAVIALPAYQGYTVRAEVRHGIQFTARTRSLVAEYMGQRGALPRNNRVLGLPAPEAVQARYVGRVYVSDGKVVVTYGHRADARIRGGHVVLSPVGAATKLRWRCHSPDIAARYLPRQCRDQ